MVELQVEQRDGVAIGLKENSRTAHRIGGIRLDAYRSQKDLLATIDIVKLFFVLLRTSLGKEHPAALSVGHPRVSGAQHEGIVCLVGIEPDYRTVD